MATEEASAIAELIERTVDVSVPQPFGAYLFADDDPAAEIARSIERAVFLEAFGNTGDLLDAEYGQYGPTSLFACIIDHAARRGAGVIRLILPSPGGPGLKSLNDVEATWGTPALTLLGRVGITPRRGAMWDAATLAVAAQYRTAAATGLVSLGLYQTIVRAARTADVSWFCALLDRVVYRVANAKYATPFDAYGEATPYLGSPATLPVTVDLDGWERRLAQREPEIGSIIFDATGIEPALRSLPVPVAETLVSRALAPITPPDVSRPTRAESTARGASTTERAR